MFVSLIYLVMYTDRLVKKYNWHIILGSLDAVQAVVEGEKFDDVCNYVKMNSSENLFPLKMVERWGTTHNLLVAAAYGDIDAQRLIKAFESEDGYEKEKYNYDKVYFTTPPIYAFIKDESQQ